MPTNNEYNEWYNIPGLDNYLASKDGRIKNIKTNYVTTGSFTGNYYKVYINGKQTYVHRLICITFHGEPPDRSSVINHLDGNKLNNHYKNLEWSTHKLNNNHAINNNLLIFKSKKIFVYDVLNKKHLNDESISSLIKNNNGYSRSGIFNSILNMNVYKNRYLVSFNEITDEHKQEALKNCFMYKYWFDNFINISFSITEISKKIGYDNAEFISEINSGRQLFGKYLIKKYLSESDWMSRDQLINLLDSEVNDVLVYDIKNGIKYLFSSASNAAIGLKINVKTISKALKTDNHKIHDQYLVKYFRDSKNISWVY